MEIREIIDFLEGFAPPETAEEYDNVGLLVGRENAGVSRVLLCLDVDENVVCEAQKRGAELIISHHPLIFHPLKAITDRTPLGETVLSAAEKKIAVYAAHTNLDWAEGGLNDYFLEKAGLSSGAAIEGRAGRICTLSPPLTVGGLCLKIKKAFGLKYIRTTADPDRTVEKIALCTGGGGGLSESVLQSGAQIYISGDIKHHEARDLHWGGVGLIEISHYDSEHIAAELLKKLLDDRFAGRLETLISESDRDLFNIL